MLAPMSPSHHWLLRVYYEDTDAGGIVYYANYLRFIERARSEWLRAIGFANSDLIAQEGVFFVVRHCKIDYQKSAFLDDALVVKTTLRHLGGSSLTLQQDVWREQDGAAALLLVACEVVLVCVAKAGQPKRIPTGLRAKLAMAES